MAFPTTSVLDAFNRANGLLGGTSGWGQSALATGNSGVRIISNQAGLTASGFESIYWSSSTFGPDAEVYCDLATAENTNEVVFLLARLASPHTNSPDGYGLAVDRSGSSIDFYRIDNGSQTSLGSISQTINSGDSVGLAVVGSQLQAWYKTSGGSWTQIGTHTDATYSAAGSVGFETRDTVNRLDNFGGGTVVAGGTAYTLAASPGSYTLTGTASKPVAGRVVGAAPGSYALTGDAAAAVAGRSLPAAPGSYALTGDAAGTLAGRVLGASPGAYVLTGAAATLGSPAAFALDAAPGSFALTGASAATSADRVLGAAPGAYGLTGVATGLLAARLVTALPGAYDVAGDAAALPASRVVLASPGSYAVAGIAADLALPGAYTLDAAPGAYALTGDAAGLLAARKLDAAPGSYALTGDAVGTALERVLLAGPGSLALTGAAALLAAALAARIGTVAQSDRALASVALADAAPTVTLTEDAPTVALSDRIST